MALIWADGFDHYGTGETGRSNMLAGAWVHVGSTVTPSTAAARTGDASLRIGQSFVNNACVVRRVFPGPARSRTGVGFGYLLPSLPVNSGQLGWQWSDSTGPLITMLVQTDGSIQIRRGGRTTGVVVGVTDAGLLQAGGFQHVEVALTVDPIVGSVEIRIEGVTRYRIDDVNTGAQPVTQFTIGDLFPNFNVVHYVDDLFAWDDTGDHCNDFLGPQRVSTYFPESDGSPSDWTVVGAGSASGAVDDAAPDGDGSYISAEDEGTRTIFNLPDVPPETAAIAAVYVPAMAKMSEPGVSRLRFAMLSGADEVEAPIISLSPLYSYYGSVFEYNPTTGEPWTRDSYNAAQLRIEKVD